MLRIEKDELFSSIIVSQALDRNFPTDLDQQIEIDDKLEVFMKVTFWTMYEILERRCYFYAFGT